VTRVGRRRAGLTFCRIRRALNNDPKTPMRLREMSVEELDQEMSEVLNQ
jgi:hypothetical protein